MARKSDGTFLLVDADVVAYQHAAGGQKDFDFDGIKAAELAPLEDCVEAARAQLKEWSKKFNATILLCFSDPDANFRKDILPTYKSNRVQEKPQHLKAIRAELSKHYKVYQKATLEGDDVMGILATWPVLKGRKIIVSIDKDMQQIPGELYNPNKDTLVKISKLQGLRYHMTQTLTGDAVDGYKGCIGCGPVGAKKALANLKSPFDLWLEVIHQYHTRGTCGDNESPNDYHERIRQEALVQARVAKILQTEDYDFKERKPILWTPPKA